MDELHLPVGLLPLESEVCPLSRRAASFGVDTLDQRLGLLGGTAVVNQYMCARLSKCQRSGSSNSTEAPVTSAVLL